MGSIQGIAEIERFEDMSSQESGRFQNSAKTLPAPERKIWNCCKSAKAGVTNFWTRSPIPIAAVAGGWTHESILAVDSWHAPYIFLCPLRPFPARPARIPSALSVKSPKKSRKPKKRNHLMRRKALRTAAKRRRKAIQQPLKGARMRAQIAIRKRRKRKKPGKK